MNKKINLQDKKIENAIITSKIRSQSPFSDPKSLSQYIAKPIKDKMFRTGSTELKQFKPANPFGVIKQQSKRKTFEFEFVGSVSKQGKNRIIYLPKYLVESSQELPAPKKKVKITITMESI